MKRTFRLPQSSLYDCTLHIRDSKGARAYVMTANPPLGMTAVDQITVSVEGDAVEIVALPKLNEALLREMDELHGESFWQTLAVKAIRKAVNSVIRATVLYTAVTYRLPLRERIGRDGPSDGSIHLQLIDRLFQINPEWMQDVLGTHPVLCAFFELSENDRPLQPATVRDLNGLEVIRAARKFVLAESTGGGILTTVVVYPFLMGQLKRQVRPRLILRKLKRLYRLSPEDRAEHFLDFEDDEGL